jgi:hypothetical protein
MHIAVCVWGLTRSVRVTHTNLRAVLDHLRSFATVTVCMHTYRLNRLYSNQWGKEVGIRLDPNEYKLLDPDHFIWDDQDDVARTIPFEAYHTFPDTIYKTNYETIDNFILAMWSLQRVTDLMLRHASSKGFTHVVFMRPDVVFDTPIKERYFSLVDDTTIVTPQFGRVCGSELAVNDRFAICTPAVARIYGRRFRWILPYSTHTPLCSESFLQWVLQTHGIRVLRRWICFNRVRADGRISDDCRTEY